MGSQGPLKRRCRSKLLVSDSPRGSNSCHCQTARTLTPWRVMMDGRDRVEEFPSDWRSSLLRPTSAHKWHRLVSAVSRARSRFLDGSILAGSIRRGCCGWNVWRQWRRDGRGGFDMSSARAAMLERGSGRMRLTSWTLQRALHDLSGEGGSGAGDLQRRRPLRVKAAPVNRDLSLPIRASIYCQTAPVPGFGMPRASSQDSLHQEFHVPARLTCSAPNGSSRSPGLEDCVAQHGRLVYNAYLL
jgi:hypothetical protein